MRYQFWKMIERNELPEVVDIHQAIKDCDEYLRALVEGRPARDLSIAQVQVLGCVEGTKHALPSELATAMGWEEGATYNDAFADANEEVGRQGNPVRFGWLGASEEEFSKNGEEYRRQQETAVGA